MWVYWSWLLVLWYYCCLLLLFITGRNGTFWVGRYDRWTIFASSLNPWAHKEVNRGRSNHLRSESSFHWVVFSPNLFHYHPSLFISSGLLVSITGGFFSGLWNSLWALLVVISIIYCFHSCGPRAPNWKSPAEPLCLFPNLPESPVRSEMWFWLECTRVRKSHIHWAHPAVKKCSILSNSSCHTHVHWTPRSP